MATAARSKVVKLEETPEVAQFREDSFLLLKPDSSTWSKPRSANKAESKPRESILTTPVSVAETSNVGDACDIVGEDVKVQQESKDTLFPLPEGWPHIPRLFRRRSCEFTSNVSTCVNKASSHLELLQNIIEEWFQQLQRELVSAQSGMGSRSTSASSHLLPGKGAACVRKQLHFVPPSSATTEGGHTGSDSSGPTPTPASRQLSVQGVAGHADVDDKTAAHAAEPEYEVPYLGAEEVIEEVIALLARLESDRVDTQQSLEQERQRSKMLKTKIDKLALTRAEQLPDAVQAEHEACAQDISELQWHVSYRGRARARIKNKVEIAEVLNCRLKEDIAFVTKHCPLVQEKLDLEKDAMDRIKNAQHETNDELDLTVDRSQKVGQKSEEAHTKADTERAVIKKDLDSVREDLAKISEDLSQAKMSYNAYIHQCNDYRQQLKDNQQQLIIMEVKNENAKAAESMQAVKVKDLQARIVEQEFQHRKLEDENNRLQANLEMRLATNKNQEKEMELAITHKQSQLKKLQLKNQELKMDIEDFSNKIYDCERQKIADEKNLVRMDKEMLRTEDQMKATLQELNKVQVINTAIRDELHTEEDKCVQTEEALRSTADALKKQVKDEIHSRTVIQARITSDGGELIKTKTETKQKTEKAEKKVSEVDEAVMVVLTKVEKLRAVHEVRSRAIDDLKKQLSDVASQLEATEKEANAQIAELTPHHTGLKNDILGLEKRLDHMEWRSEMMTKKMEDMDASSSMMTRVVDNAQKAIDVLKDELDELTVQLEAGQYLDDDLRSSLTMLTSRNRDLDTKHKDLIRDRKHVLANMQKEYQQNLELNKELAARYRTLQNDYVHYKNQLMNHFDDRVKLESTIKDVKQLHSLQMRMRGAVLEYYKYRKLYNEAELARMEAQSTNNGVRVSELQEQMDGALDTISTFIQNQMDGSAARRMAMERVDRIERRQKRRETRENTKTQLVRPTTQQTLAAQS